jgi:type VI secretion system protein VasD
MDLARRAILGAVCIGMAGCTATRQTLSDMTGWVSEKLDPSPPPPPPPPPPAAALPAPKAEVPPPKPVLVVPARQLQVAVKASELLNPDAFNRSSPVVIRVYLLRAELAFGAADFHSLFEQDATTLGPDLLARVELQLRPGRATSITRDLPAEAQYLGVVAAFRNVERSTWRALSSLPIPPAPVATPPSQPLKVPVQISIDGSAISVSLG